MKLYEIADQYIGALSLLDDPEMPEEAVSDTLEAIEGDFSGKGVAVVAWIKNSQAEAAVIDEEVKKLQARSKALKNKTENAKGYLLHQMQKVGSEEVKDAIHGAKIRKDGSKSVVVDNIDSLPREYVKTKTTETADKTAIKKAIQEGAKIEGAHIETKDTLTIK
jgi:hypothetical protein